MVQTLKNMIFKVFWRRSAPAVFFVFSQKIDTNIIIASDIQRYQMGKDTSIYKHNMRILNPCSELFLDKKWMRTHLVCVCFFLPLSASAPWRIHIDPIPLVTVLCTISLPVVFHEDSESVTSFTIRPRLDGKEIRVYLFFHCCIFSSSLMYLILIHMCPWWTSDILSCSITLRTFWTI